MKNLKKLTILHSNDMHGDFLAEQIDERLSQYADNEQTKGDWRLLNGKRWMVFGEASKMTALQQQWGGELETITAAADTADSGNA